MLALSSFFEIRELTHYSLTPLKSYGRELHVSFSENAPKLEAIPRSGIGVKIALGLNIDFNGICPNAEHIPGVLFRP